MKIIVVPLSEIRGQDKRSLYHELKVKHAMSQNNDSCFLRPTNSTHVPRRGAMGEAFDAK
jgi:hypothetical protein